MNLNRFCYLLLAVTAVGSFFSPHPRPCGFARQRSDAGDIRHGQNGGAQGLAQSAGSHLAGVWGGRGWPGAILGQQLFRHKTQKQPFKTWFIFSVIVSIAMMVGIYMLLPMEDVWLKR